MEQTNNDDKIFLTGLSDLYKLWQNTLAAEEDLKQDKKTLNYLEGFSSDESYGKKALRENHKNLVNKKSNLKNATIQNRTKLDEATENVKKTKEDFDNAKKKFKNEKAFTRSVTIAIFVLIALVVGCFTIGPSIVTPLCLVDLGDGMTGIDFDKRDFFGGVLIVVIISSIILTIFAIKVRFNCGVPEPREDEYNKAVHEENKISSDLATAENELEVVEAKIIEKTNEYASRRPGLINALTNAVNSKSEVFNSLVKNLNEFQNSDHRFPKEQDFYKIPMIVEYWETSYAKSSEKLHFFQKFCK